jgi:hypothetical protein
VVKYTTRESHCIIVGFVHSGANLVANKKYIRRKVGILWWIIQKVLESSITLG